MQVYMVAMQQERDKQSKQKAGAATPSGDDDEDDDDDFSEFGAGESLLSLVQPEMVTLSKHWLDALKDHALLSLPAGGHLHAHTHTPRCAHGHTHDPSHADMEI